VTCEERRELIVARIAGLLRGEAARELRDHIRDCSDCTDWFYYYEKLWKDLDEWPNPDDQIGALAPPLLPRKRAVRFPARWLYAAAAAAATILLVIGAVIAFRSLSTNGPAETPVAGQSRQTPETQAGAMILAAAGGAQTRPVRAGDRITLPAGARAWVQLADGHGFCLSREASLELMSAEDAPVRRVKIHGGMVDVCEERPRSGLELLVPGGRLTVKGTCFRVTVSPAKESCPAGKAHTEVVLYEGRVAAEGTAQGRIALEPRRHAIITEFKDKGRIEGRLLGVEQVEDLIGRPLQALRIQSDHVGECLLLVPDSSAPVEASAGNLAAAVKKLMPGDAVAVSFALGEDGLWVQRLEKRSEAGPGAFLACETAFGALDAQARARLARRFGPGSNPKAWARTAARAAETIESAAARRYAMRLLADRLDEVEHGRDAMSALAALIEDAGLKDVEAAVFPALYRVFFTHRDPILWQRAAEILLRLKDPVAAEPLRLAAEKFAGIHVFPKVVKVHGGFGSYDMEYNEEDRQAQQKALLETIAKARHAISES